MDPYQSPAPQPDDTKAWFADAQGPASSPSNSPVQKSSTRKILIIMAVVAIVVVAIASVVKFFSVEACLTPEDYRSFVGQAPDAQLSPQAFYTASFDFPAESDEFSNASAGVSDQALRKIAALDVKKHASSLTITLSADYYANDSYQAAVSRLEMLKQKLITYGASESDIVVKDPEEIGSGDTTGEEYVVPDEAIAYARIASAAACR